MILFVFEGRKREPNLFRAIESLFFKDRQHIVCSFDNNIYELYKKLRDFDDAGDIISVLREKYLGSEDSPFPENARSSDFSEIYLIFDYDFQNKNIPVTDMNRQISEMLEMFDNETENGKLYINYPMVEAIRYTKRLPDSEFYTYTVSRQLCAEVSFKKLSDEFSDYKSLDFLTLNEHRSATESEIRTRTKNWMLLQEQNVIKANYLCTGCLSMPENKDDVSQKEIFDAQLQDYVLPKDCVSILSAFPMFLYEYFPAPAGLSLKEDNESRIAALKSAIEEGLDSGIVEDFDSDSHLKSMKGTR